MSDQVQKNMQVLMHFFDAMNSGDYAQIMKVLNEFYTEDYILHDPTLPGDTQGLKKNLADFDSWWENNSVVHAAIEDLIGMGDKTAARTTLEYVEKKTQEKKKIVYIFFSRYKNGRIAEECQMSSPG
jgi:ketosteroid isomerase-like protein